MEKSIYIVTAFIPSDENIVVSNIYKLQKLGEKNKIFIFISIENSGGIGTALDDFGSETAEDCILNSTKFVTEDLFEFIKTNNFDDVLFIRSKFIKKLQTKLGNKL